MLPKSSKLVLECGTKYVIILKKKNNLYGVPKIVGQNVGLIIKKI